MNQTDTAASNRPFPTKPGRAYWVYVVILPLLFFSLYAALNIQYFRSPLEETGDDAASALQIERAKHFRELLGPYSRFDFHHPGPVSFYYYAFTERLLPHVLSPYGKHRFAQLLLNLLLFIMAMHIVFVSFRRKYAALVFFCCLVIGLARFPFGGDVLSRIWPPALLVFPMVTFVLAAAKVAFGEIGYILPAVIGGIVIVQNNVSGLVVVLPLCAAAVLLYLWKRRNFSLSLSRRDLRTIAISGLALAVAFLPTIWEQFAPEGKNLTRIVEFGRAHPSFSHSLSEALGYVSAFYLFPFPFLKIKPLYVLVLLWLTAAVTVGRRRSFSRTLALFLFLGLCCSIAGAMKIPGKLLYYIMSYEVSLVILLLFICLVGPFGLIRPFRFQRMALFFGLAVFVLCMTFRFYRVMPVPERSPKLDLLIENIAPSREFIYELYWRKDGLHHEQWTTATGLALKLIRQGYAVSVPPEWGFMFGRDLITPGGKNNIRRISLYSADRRMDRVRRYRYMAEDTVIEFGEIIPMPLPVRLTADSPDEYFVGWRPASGQARSMEGSSACVLFPLGDLGFDERYRLTIAGRAVRGKMMSVTLNGSHLATINFLGDAVEEEIDLEADVLKKNALNSLELNDLDDPRGPGPSLEPFRFAVDWIELSPHKGFQGMTPPLQSENMVNCLVRKGP